ncbi:hypothetical protein V2J09_001788 [Rumex salicifolius]
MMRMKNKLTGLLPPTDDPAAVEWEMRPGGMLVQKRVDSDQNATPPPTIRVRVKYGPVYHEITISSQATFGELKKKLTDTIGLHHEDQKVLFKDKERDSKAFLDVSGVKEKSKLVVMEDPIKQEKRLLELRRNTVMENAAKSISNIRLEVDRLAVQVLALESVISKGGKVAEKDVVSLTELLMNELIKLDAIVAQGDTKSQRKIQVTRVQKYVETLDMIKMKSLTLMNNESRPSQIPTQPRHANAKDAPQTRQPLRNHTSGTVVTTKWETFDSTSNSFNTSSSLPPLPPKKTMTRPYQAAKKKVTWDLL